MRNVWLVFRRDVSNLFRNVMCVIITVGLVVLPSLFAWYNILACWNVFDNTGNLSVAVASQDEGYASDLIPLEVNVGEKVLSALRANKQINWVFTNADDAVEGTRSGKYYAALVIPENFSSQMLTFYEGDSASASIKYYVNEKKNAISPNITGAGADTLSYEVNATFADTVSEVGAGLAKALANFAADSDTRGSIEDLASHMRLVSSRLGQTADVLGLYSSLGTEAANLLASTVDFVEAARAKAGSAVSDVDASKQAIRNLAGDLESAVGSLSGYLAEGKSALSGLEGKADALLTSASSDASAVASELRGVASDIGAKGDALSSRRDALADLRDKLHSGAVRERNKMISNGVVEAEISTHVEITVENTVVLDEAIAVLDKAIVSLQKANANLVAAADDLDAVGPGIQQDADALRQTIAQTKASLETTIADFEQSLAPGIQTLKADLQKLASDFDGISSNMGSLGSDLAGVTDGVESSLAELTGKVDSASGSLRSAAQNMASLADRIDAALASGDVGTLRSLLANDAESIAAALSAPVQIQRKALFPVDNFGSAMAPLYCTLGLFIGALLIMVATKPEVSARGMEQVRNPKPRQLYFGRFGVVGLLSLLQTTLLGLGSMFLLKVQVTEPVLFMVCFSVAGLVFSFIIYTLVVAFGNLGKAIAVLLLIVQVTACGGSYPLPIMPDFVQALSPWVPATHVVDALRAAMFGVYQNDFWISLGKLALFLIPFLLLGLVLRKPLEGFMKFYVSKVEESKMME